MKTWEVALSTGDTGSDVPQGLNYRSAQQLVKEDFVLSIPITFPGAKVRYSFGTDGYDISFTMTSWNEATGEETIVVEEDRVSSHLEPIHGEKGPFPFDHGVLVLRWDNTFSWFRHKHLSYSVSIDYPKGAALHRSEVMHDRQRLVECNLEIGAAAGKGREAKATHLALTKEVHEAEAQLRALQASIEDKRAARAAAAAEGAAAARKLAIEKGGVRDLVLNLVVRDGWVELPEVEESAAATEGADADGSTMEQAVDVAAAAAAAASVSEEAVAEPAAKSAEGGRGVLGFWGRGSRSAGDGGDDVGASESKSAGGDAAPAVEEGGEINDDEMDEL